MSFGFTARRAEVMEIEDRGRGEKIVRLLSAGVTKRAAIRGARVDTASIIPFRDQEVLNVTFDRSIGPLNNRYIVAIGHNVDEY